MVAPGETLAIKRAQNGHLTRRRIGRPGAVLIARHVRRQASGHARRRVTCG